MIHRRAAAAVVLFALGVFAILNWLALDRGLTRTESRQSVALADVNNTSYQLPIILAPENTPTPIPTNTPEPTNTPAPTSTPEPTLIPSPTATAMPTSQPPVGGNAIVNGSFEQGWTDLPPAPGFLINQQPLGWELNWLDIGAPLWADPGTLSAGVPECLHKLEIQLPDADELILEGTVTYKMFHFGAPFGSQLYQVVGGLPPGSRWRLTVPIQAHLHGDTDFWAAESGVWAITSAEQAGGWVPGGTMGDRTWFYHQAEVTVPGDGRIEVLIRVKSKWPRGKDFFIDDVRLEPMGTRDIGGAELPTSVSSDNGRVWLASPLGDLSSDDRVTP